MVQSCMGFGARIWFFYYNLRNNSNKYERINVCCFLWIFDVSISINLHFFRIQYFTLKFYFYFHVRFNCKYIHFLLSSHLLCYCLHYLFQNFTLLLLTLVLLISCFSHCHFCYCSENFDNQK